MPFQLDLGEVQRYVDQLDEPARHAFHKALRSTANYMLSLRDGACYRYEKEILEGVKMCSLSASKRLRERILEKRSNGAS